MIRWLVKADGSKVLQEYLPAEGWKDVPKYLPLSPQECADMLHGRIETGSVWHEHWAEISAIGKAYEPEPRKPREWWVMRRDINMSFVERPNVTRDEDYIHVREVLDDN